MLMRIKYYFNCYNIVSIFLYNFIYLLIYFWLCWSLLLHGDF